MRMKPVSAVTAAAALALAGCATAPVDSTGASSERLVFPPTPASPVIEYVTTVATAADVGAGEAAWKKMLIGAPAGDEARLVAPTSVAIGPDGTLFVVDQQLDGIVVINRQQRRFELFRGEGAGRLSRPVGVAVADDGTVYVSDVTPRAVYVFSAGLRFVRAVGGPDRFVRPTGLALSPAGDRLAVCDTGGQKVHLVDSATGAEIFTLGSGERSSRDGEFSTPYTVAIDAEGYIFVADYLNFRIQVFDPDGVFDFAFGQAGDRPGDLNRPRGLAVDSANGVVYEVDGAFELVQMFNLDGELLMWFGSPGRGKAQFSLPSGLGRRGDLLAVADTLNARVQLFRFLGAPAPAAPGGD